ncbi:MAG: hypothetical protein JWM76_2483 [Pseudonocardiales bacterium]|nr:hypothetical protein [Pseudonocardiales bacterium]
MTDGLELARLARQTLAEADEVTMVIHGIGRFGSDDPGAPAVVMREIDGRATFTCEADSLLARCAGRPALLSVPGTTPAVTLVLSGRLELAPPDPDACARHRPDPGTVSVVLAATRVVLERQDVAGAPLTQHEVMLGLYRCAETPAFTAYAQSIVEHTNSSHELQLREYAAHISGQSVHAIAGASLASLDRSGARLHWIDMTGAQIEAIVFDHPARTPSALASLLREELTGAGPRPGQAQAEPGQPQADAGEPEATQPEDPCR